MAMTQTIRATSNGHVLRHQNQAEDVSVQLQTMVEIRSSFQRRKKSGSVASSGSSASNTPPTETSTNNTPRPDRGHEHSGSMGSHPSMELRESPSSQSYRSRTGSREPRTPPDADHMNSIPTSRVLFQDVSLTRSTRLGGRHSPSQLEDDLHEYAGHPSHAVWPESQLNTSVMMHPQSQYFSPDHSVLLTQPPQSSFRDLDSSKNNPMQYLMAEEHRLNIRLQELLSMHLDISAKGMSTQRVRKLIGEAFKSLDMVYDAMRELYESQHKRRHDMLTSFETWEAEKQALLTEVEEIKSKDHEEGRMLAQLQEQMLDVDDEIRKVEKRLCQLKDKKEALRGEMTQVESVIESRSSSHMEQIREIERSENAAIVKLSEDKSVISKFSQMSMSTEPTSMLGSFLMRFGPQSQVHRPAVRLTPTQVMDVMQRQLETLQDSIDDYSNKERVFRECSLIWDDTSEVLATLEKDLAVALKSQTTDSRETTKVKIEMLLTKALETLEGRVSNLKDMNDIMKTLLLTEISLLKRGIEMLDPKRKAPEFRPSPQPLQAAPAKPSFVTSPAEPVLSASPLEAIPALSAGKALRAGSFNSLKNNLRRSSSAGTKADKND